MTRYLQFVYETWLIHSDVSNTILSNIERTRTSIFEHRTDTNMFINWESNFERTSNEHRTYKLTWKKKCCNFLLTFQILRCDFSNQYFYLPSKSNTFHFLWQNEFFLWYFKTSNYWKLIAKSIFESMLMFTKCSSNSTSNIERTLNVFIYSDRTRTPNFCLRTNGHRTSNIVRPITTIFASKIPCRIVVMLCLQFSTLKV